VRSAKWEQNGGGSHDSGEAGFLSGISDGISSTSQRPIFSSLNLATMREFEDIRSSKEICENFSFKGHLSPKTSKLQGSNRYLTLTRNERYRVAMRDALQHDIVHSAL